jgi:hypothetical protein
MKRQLTRKLSTAEFAHSHSGPRPTSDPAPIPMAMHTSLRPGTVHIHTDTHMPITYQYWGSAAPPPRVSPVSARRRAAARALGSEAWAEGDGAWRERRRRAAAGRRAKTSKMATPCGHQPTYRGAVGFPAIDVWGTESSSLPALYRCHLSRAHAHLGRPRDVAGPHRRGVCERGGRTRL